jgi:hypothetical protein
MVLNINSLSKKAERCTGQTPGRPRPETQIHCARAGVHSRHQDDRSRGVESPMWQSGCHRSYSQHTNIFGSYILRQRWGSSFPWQSLRYAAAATGACQCHLAKTPVGEVAGAGSGREETEMPSVPHTLSDIHAGSPPDSESVSVGDEMCHSCERNPTCEWTYPECEGCYQEHTG